MVGEVLDAAGESKGFLTPYAEGTTIPASRFGFVPLETKELALPWPTGQLAPGAYTIVVRVVEPDTINASRPRGEILAENSGFGHIVATSGISGAMSIDPPLTQAGTATPVAFTALVRNAGNVPLPEAFYELTVRHPDSGALLYSAQSPGPALDAGVNAPVAFDAWVPTGTGNLIVRVRAVTAGVAGEITGSLYVGDRASGSFTVDRNTVREGTSTVRGRISMQGVDVRQGSSTDPLFQLVKAAVEKGGLYTAPGATNWHRTNRCLGCHIQTQSLFGLASAADKASIDGAATQFLYNTIATSQQTNGALYISHPEFAKTQTHLGIWALGAWPDKGDSFRAMFRAAKYLHSVRSQSGGNTFWTPDHASGWWYSNVASTALAVSGITDVLRAAETVDLAGFRDYALGPALNTGAGSGPLDMEVGPDGGLYIVKYSGAIVRLNPQTGESSVAASGFPSTAYGLAFGPDGTMFVSGNTYLRRLNPDGTSQLLLSSTGTLTDVELGPDGLLYVADWSNHRICRVTPATGQSEIFVSGGLIQRPYGLAFDAAGNLLVANNARANILKVAPDRTISVHADGLAYGPVYLAMGEGGEIYASSTVNGVMRISPDGVGERLIGAASQQLYGVASVQGRLYAASHNTNALHEVLQQPLDTTALGSLRNELPRVANYFLSNYRDNASDNIVQAMRMIGLSYLREAITDLTLLANINTAIAYEDTLLRGRQRADGGWGRSVGQASDPLVTAMVGIAIDYTDPSPNDP